jgi:hypothetical protein
MKKEKLVAALIANTATPWTDDDKDGLMAMEESMLEKLSANTTPAPTDIPAPVVVDDKTKDADDKPTDTPTPAMNMDAYVANAPAEYRDVLLSGLAAHRAQKAGLIGQIVANAANKFSKEFLETKGIEELTGLAAIATAAVPAPDAPAAPVPMFDGAATPTGNQSQPTNNGGGLPLPVMTFGPDR